MANSARPSLYSGRQPSFPLTPILDNFNRANEGPPPSANWTGDFDPGFGDDLIVLDNLLQTSFGNGSAYWNQSIYGPDCEVYSTVRILVPDSTAWELHLWARMSLDPLKGYRMIVYSNTVGSPCDVELDVLDGGGHANDILDISNLPAIQNGDVFGMRFVGNTISCLRNGVFLGQAVSTAVSGAGLVGITIGTAANNTNYVIDDFGGGTVKTTSTFEAATSGAADVHQQQWSA